MNIFPLDVQYLISEFIINKNEGINKKEIILLYTYPEYSNRSFKAYYYQKKIINEEIILEYYYPKKIINEKKIYNQILFHVVVKCGNIRVMKWLLKNGCHLDHYMRHTMTTCHLLIYLNMLQNMEI